MKFKIKQFTTCWLYESSNKKTLDMFMKSEQMGPSFKAPISQQDLTGTIPANQIGLCSLPERHHCPWLGQNYSSPEQHNFCDSPSLYAAQVLEQDWKETVQALMWGEGAGHWLGTGPHATGGIPCSGETRKLELNNIHLYSNLDAESSEEARGKRNS